MAFTDTNSTLYDRFSRRDYHFRKSLPKVIRYFGVYSSGVQVKKSFHGLFCCWLSLKTIKVRRNNKLKYGWQHQCLRYYRDVSRLSQSDSNQLINVRLWQYHSTFAIPRFAQRILLVSLECADHSVRNVVFVTRNRPLTTFTESILSARQPSPPQPPTSSFTRQTLQRSKPAGQNTSGHEASCKYKIAITLPLESWTSINMRRSNAKQVPSWYLSKLQ